jgi:hypothetical protein
VEYADIELDRLVDAPWRLSENPADRDKLRPSHANERAFTRVQSNIAASLRQFGQLSPIHVRPLEGSAGYQILDGHVVVAAAREVGIPALTVVVHRGLTDRQAQLRYLQLKFCRRNRTVFFRVLENLYDTSTPANRAAAVADLLLLTRIKEKTLKQTIQIVENVRQGYAGLKRRFSEPFVQPTADVSPLDFLDD